MATQSEPQDFTVEVSMKEKALTGLLFAIGMGASVYFARKYSLIEGHPPHIYFNLSFALAVFGIVRMLRAVFQQKRRGLLADENQLMVATLFSQPDLPYSEIRSTKFTIKDRPTPEVSFMWGQFRYRLPCSNTQKLSELLVSKGVPVVFSDEGVTSFRDVVQRLEETKPVRYRPQRPPAAVLLSLIFWAVGTVAMFYTARL